MRVGIYSPWDTCDPRSWSGVVHPMVEALGQAFEVEIIPPVTVSDAFLERLRTRARGQFGRRSLPTHTIASARRRSAALRDALLARPGPPLDALVAIASSTDVLDVPAGLPLVQVTDATFPAITGFYPLATGLGQRNERQGMAVETAGAAVTSHYAVATEWAARSLVETVGVAPERVSVVPFGPGTPALDDVVIRRPEGPLKVLAVIADWERKRGDDIVEAVRLARKMARVSLTVVGRAPVGLPEWVRTEGMVSHERLAVLYAEHDLLVDLARANAAGVVLTDALVSGLPVIATRVGGVETIVQDGRTGWLVAADSAVTETADQLVRLTKDRVASASAAALEDGQARLTWEAWARGMADIVLRSVDGAGRRPMSSPSEKPPFAMVSPVLPSAKNHESAGERLLREILDVVEEDRAVTVLTREGPATQRAVERGGVPPHLSLRHMAGAAGRPFRALGLSPVLWPRELGTARTMLSAADVLDVQWEENGLLLGALRRLNPKARIVITLHDVLSQRFQRQRDLQTSRARRAVWEVRRLAALALELSIVRRADEVVVLSAKDAALLPRRGRRARVHVVPPAITGSLRAKPTARQAGCAPMLLFVGFMARWENEDAMHWFITDILPSVRAAAPDVRVVVAGGGLRDHVVAELRAAQVEVLGFVDDLEPLYGEAAAVVVPLRYGAGVKFKVVDALVRGVPVVTTRVGNEGILPTQAAVVADDADDFARAVVRILDNPVAAEHHARSVAPSVAEEFGTERFRARLKEVYR